MVRSKKPRVRADTLVMERGFAASRDEAERLLLAGDARILGFPGAKAGDLVPASSDVVCEEAKRFVGRGAFKLEGALEEFGIDLTDRITADVGACTGGFTDVMLQAGAEKVYAIDVGYGDLDWRLRQDERVVVMERTNARYVHALDEKVSFVAIDVSFISLSLILPQVVKWVTSNFDVVALIKPQFEASSEEVPQGGVVADTAVHRQVIRRIIDKSQELGFEICGVAASSIKGAEGNQEYLLWLKEKGSRDVCHDVGEVIEAAIG